MLADMADNHQNIKIIWPPRPPTNRHSRMIPSFFHALPTLLVPQYTFFTNSWSYVIGFLMFLLSICLALQWFPYLLSCAPGTCHVRHGTFVVVPRWVQSLCLERPRWVQNERFSFWKEGLSTWAKHALCPRLFELTSMSGTA